MAPEASFEFVDLFAGIGGFHAVLSSLGGQLRLAVEIDPSARETYKRNWGALPERDVVEMAGPRLEEIGDHAVLAGGFPCQPFSKSGQQRGMGEHRGQMFDEIMRIARRYRPPVLFLENVRNIVGPRQRATWQHIVGSMREAGYRVTSDPLVASPHRLGREDGGAPQSRERVYILGTYVGRDVALRDIDRRPLVVDTIGWDPADWDLQAFMDPGLHDDSPTLSFSAEERVWLETWNSFLASTTDVHLPGFPLWSMYWHSEASVDPAAPLWKQKFERKNIEFYYENREAISGWLRANPQLRTFPRSRQKLEWQAGDAPRDLLQNLVHLRPSGIRVKKMNYAPALVAMAQIPLVGPMGRRMSPEETARLQNFPPDFQLDHQSAASSYKQLGNAINVGVAYRVFVEHVRRDADEIGTTETGSRLVNAVQGGSRVPHWLQM